MTDKYVTEIEDALSEPIEIRGWLLDAMVSAVVEKCVHSTECMVDDETYEVTEIETGPIQVVNHEGAWLRLDQEHIDKSLKEEFAKKIEALVLKKAEGLADKEWELTETEEMV